MLLWRRARPALGDSQLHYVMEWVLVLLSVSNGLVIWFGGSYLDLVSEASWMCWHPRLCVNDPCLETKGMLESRLMEQTLVNGFSNIWPQHILYGIAQQQQVAICCVYWYSSMQYALIRYLSFPVAAIEMHASCLVCQWFIVAWPKQTKSFPFTLPNSIKQSFSLEMRR